MLLITIKKISVKNIYFNSICKNKYTTKNHVSKFRIVGKPKHFAPITREWANSVYSFDSDFLKQITNKYNLSNKILKGYFSLNNNLINSKRIFSRRLKSNFFRSSLNKILLSKPEIKLTNDKVNLTVYVFNNEKRIFLKKLFNYNVKKTFIFLEKVKKTLKRLGNIRLNLITSNFNNKNTFVKTLKKNLRLKKTLSIYLKTLFLRKNKKQKKLFKSISLNSKYRRSIKILKSAKYTNQMKNFYSTNLSIRDYSLLHKIFYFKFLIYLCSLFEIKLNLPKRKKASYRRLSFTPKGRLKDVIEFKVKGKSYKVNLSYLNKNCFNNKMNEKERLNVIYNTRNLVIVQFLKNILNESNLKGEQLINHFFKVFSNKYYFVFLKPQIKDNIVYFRNYIKFLINKYKFSKLLPGLKKLITKIYNRKVEINLVNLKHPSLNSDIFMQCLVFFLKAKSKVFLLKLLHRFSSKIKILPKNINFIDKDYNNIDSLTYYKSTRFNYSNLIKLEKSKDLDKDFLQGIFKKLYLYSFNPLSLKTLKLNLIDNINSTTRVKDNLKLTKLNKLTCFLNKVKYKYIVGMKIETAGRLSQRNTAERSRYSFKYIGHLRDLNYPNHYKWEKTSKNMLRNSIRSNNTYSSITSKRRIGSFGVKGWISGGL